MRIAWIFCRNCCTNGFAWTIDRADDEHRGRALAPVYIALEIGIGGGAILSAWLYDNNPQHFLFTMVVTAIFTVWPYLTYCFGNANNGHWMFNPQLEPISNLSFLYFLKKIKLKISHFLFTCLFLTGILACKDDVVEEMPEFDPSPYFLEYGDFPAT
ncbi:MAG: hypothetical protein R2784_10055 [Saprospiraceae bacterium]